jgi:hypothetical protein
MCRRIEAPLALRGVGRGRVAADGRLRCVGPGVGDLRRQPKGEDEGDAAQEASDEISGHGVPFECRGIGRGHALVRILTSAFSR